MQLNDKEQEHYSAAQKFKELYGGLTGIYNIGWGDRFGDSVISVSCISYQDEEDLKSKLPLDFHGFTIHFLGPIWNNLDLIPRFRKQYDKMGENPYYTQTPEGQKEMVDFLKECIEEEGKLWASMNPKEKRDLIVKIIKERRKRDPNFGNCADKFLT